MITATDLHPVHAANKLRMAQRLTAHLRSTGLDDPAVIAWLTDDRRARIARAAGETHTPSQSTWAMVVVLLETPVLTAVPADGSEFVGLPR